MKWLRTLIIFDHGDIGVTSDWKTVHDSFVRSIESLDFPPGTGTLTVRRKVKTSPGKYKRNGVSYLKKRFVAHLC